MNSLDTNRTLIKKHKKFGARRSSGVLNLVYIDIFGPFPIASWNSHEYFITFIDDYSRYGYLYLLHEKSQSLDMFKSITLKLKINCIKKLKPLDLIVVVSITAYTMDQVDVQNHLSIFGRVWHCHLVHHTRDTSSEWCC